MNKSFFDSEDLELMLATLKEAYSIQSAILGAKNDQQGKNWLRLGLAAGTKKELSKVISAYLHYKLEEILQQYSNICEEWGISPATNLSDRSLKINHLCSINELQLIVSTYSAGSEIHLSKLLFEGRDKSTYQLNKKTGSIIYRSVVESCKLELETCKIEFSQTYSSAPIKKEQGREPTVIDRKPPACLGLALAGDEFSLNVLIHNYELGYLKVTDVHELSKEVGIEIPKGVSLSCIGTLQDQN